MRVSLRAGVLPVLMVLLLAIVGACGAQATPTPTPTPTPSPTPTPVPSAVALLGIDGDTLVRDLIGALLESEAACMRESFTAERYDALLDLPVVELPEELGADFPTACFTADTIVSLAVGAIAAEAGGLSTETEGCIRSAFESVDVSGLVVTGDVAAEQTAPLMGTAIGLLLCLSDEEAARIDAGRFLGAPGAATLQDVRCVMQQLDFTEMIDLFGGIAEGGLENLPLNLVPVLLDCGVDLSGGGSSDPSGTDDATEPGLPLTPPDLSELDPELLAVAECLREALGEEALNEIATGQRLPTLAEFGALGECDFDLSQLGDLGDLLPSS